MKKLCNSENRKLFHILDYTKMRFSWEKNPEKIPEANKLKNWIKNIVFEKMGKFILNIELIFKYFNTSVGNFELIKPHSKIPTKTFNFFFQFYLFISIFYFFIRLIFKFFLNQ